MAVTTEEIRTDSGDTVIATLMTDSTEGAEIFVTVVDADESRVPTARFTLLETVELRAVLRRLCEMAQRGT